MSRRLIEEWLPIAALGEESVRERRSMTALPPTYYLHVWWARRPLVASRAAILAALLPDDADKGRFLHALGIHGDPVAAKRAMEWAQRKGERIANPYTYSRAFSYMPSTVEQAWMKYEMARIGIKDAAVLDPTAGGGSIPMESQRLGLTTIGNDLNPVAVLIQQATYDFPPRYGLQVKRLFEQIACRFRGLIENRLHEYFPQVEAPDVIDTTYLWARAITCPYCDGLIPLSPNWKLAPDGTGIRLHPHIDSGVRRCSFEIVGSAKQQSEGTVSDG